MMGIKDGGLIELAVQVHCQQTFWGGQSWPHGQATMFPGIKQWATLQDP